MLSDDNDLKVKYLNMLSESNLVDKKRIQDELRSQIRMGTIDVNIMTKLDRDNYDSDGQLLPNGFSDALSASEVMQKVT